MKQSLHYEDFIDDKFLYRLPVDVDLFDGDREVGP